MRKLKHHEKKLLKKVDFFNWEVDNNLHELKIMRKYRILKRENYTMYNKLSRYVQLYTVFTVILKRCLVKFEDR